MDARAADATAIDALTAAFYGAFTNRNGSLPNVDLLHDLFTADAAIIKTVGGVMERHDLAGFIAPRRTILTDGTLTDFSEEEVSAKTEIFGNIAHRFSRYRKSWTAGGDHINGSGTKSIQFVRTPAGWKIASLTWDDDPNG